MKSELGKSSGDGNPLGCCLPMGVCFQDTLKIQGCGAYGKNNSSWPPASHAGGPTLVGCAPNYPKRHQPQPCQCVRFRARLSPDSYKHGPNVQLQSQGSIPYSYISVESVSYFKSSCLKWLTLLCRLSLLSRVQVASLSRSSHPRALLFSREWLGGNQVSKSLGFLKFSYIVSSKQLDLGPFFTSIQRRATQSQNRSKYTR